MALLPPELTILEKSFLTTKHAGLTLVQDSRGKHKNKQPQREQKMTTSKKIIENIKKLTDAQSKRLREWISGRMELYVCFGLEPADDYDIEDAACTILGETYYNNYYEKIGQYIALGPHELPPPTKEEIKTIEILRWHETKMLKNLSSCKS